MNYGSNPNFSYSGQPYSVQQYQNVTNNGFNNLSMSQQYQGMYPYANNFQFPQTQYIQSQSSTLNHPNSTVKYPPKYTENTVTVTKRQFTPLTVLDPVNKEAIDLVKASKSLKSPLSVVEETPSDFHNTKAVVSVSAIVGTNENTHQYIDQVTEVTTVIEHNNVSHHQSNFKEMVEDEQNQINDVDCTEDQHNHEPRDSVEKRQYPTETVLNSNYLQTIQCSKSIPNSLESISNGIHHFGISSLEDNLYEKSDSSTGETNDCDQNRLVYSREILLEIAKSPLCRKPALDCKEIEVTTNKIINLNKIGMNEVLDCSENGYKPPNKRLNEENTYLETSRRQFKSILNKIAPQNFLLCFQEVKALLKNTDWTNVSVEDYMNCIIDEIFHKAVQEEGYSVTYADLCTEVTRYEQQNNTKWNFNAQLIQRCKTMFQTPLQTQLTSVRDHWLTKIEEETDEKLKILYQSDIEEQVKKAKDKFFGNIRFIGELYLHNLLKPKIIEICVEELLSKREEEDSMLSLCKLLETCGKKFESAHRDKMDEYITTMHDIIKTTDLHRRIRFRLSDIVDMRQRNWTLRAIQAEKIIKPKTLDQVKQDEINEKRLKASKLSNKSQSRDNKKSTYHSELKFKHNHHRNQTLEINSLQMQNTHDYELQPPQCSWTSGSGVKDQEWREKNTRRFNKSNNTNGQQNHKSILGSPRDESLPEVAIGGRFAAILQLSDPDDNCVIDESTLLLQDQIPEIPEEIQTESSIESSTREPSPTNLDMDDVEILDGAGIFDRFLDSGSLDIDSFCQLTDVGKTLLDWIDGIMEKSKGTRNAMGDELAKLIATGKLCTEDLIDGIKVFLEDINDLKTDIPLIWTFLAEFLERFIVDDESDISFFGSIFISKESNIDVANCISLCLKYADVRVGHAAICTLLGKCTWSLNEFVPVDRDFLLSRDLGFLLEPIIEPIRFEEFRDDLSNILSDSNESINQFLSGNFSSDLIQTKECVYFVCGCIFSHLSDLSKESIKAYLEEKSLLLLPLLDRRPQFEKAMLESLCDCSTLSEDEGLLTTVVEYLINSILSLEVPKSFAEKNSVNCRVMSTIDIIKSILEAP